ncbi:hypothetical protein SAY86_024449 [Trapa natans]|uniref:non-specific serine/threonine protein kinase n=1 Tax=Trapa natans TaxID=22666 RepID=A0AAN7RBI6_TRANT|nr:hypothetical protein SAY86_024449 [Trapa natans]
MPRRLLHCRPTEQTQMSPFFSLSIPLFFLFLLSPIPSYSAQPQNFSSLTAANSPWTPASNRVLLSNNNVFAAGFLQSSPNLYSFSVWYYNKSTPLSRTIVVWSVKAQLDNSSTLSITSGQLVLSNGPNTSNLWPSIETARPASSAKLVLHDTGSLVFSGSDWESFKVPTDTLLPNQNISGTTITSLNGRFTFNSTDLRFNNTDSYWTVSETGTGQFQMLHDSGFIQGKDGSIFSADFAEECLRRINIGNDGNLRVYSYCQNDSTEWTVVWQSNPELCKIHGSCGPNSICIGDGGSSTYCVCPSGFRNTTPDSYNCERSIPMKNMKNTKFIRLDYVNFTGGSNQTNIGSKNLSDCQARCLDNDNCLGFMYNYDGTGRCILQLDRLLYGYWSPGENTANAMFLRVDSSETEETNFKGLTSVLETTCPVNISLPLPPDESNTTTRNIAIICTLFAAELISGVAFFWAFLKKYIKYRNMAQTLGLELLPAGGPKRFTLSEVKAATNGFSDPIGKGGFGDVYKGELSDKRVVAVKCLKNVAGGDGEFWAEVTIIARMHHLNLVRLWGFCAEKGQRILIYEYVPNGSLDKYLFRSGRPTDGKAMDEVVGEMKPVLDWNIRSTGAMPQCATTGMTREYISRPVPIRALD